MSDHLTHHRRFSPAELHAQYFLRASRPDLDTKVIPAWTAASRDVRATLECSVDIRYGNGPRQLLDLFHCGSTDAPVLVFFHGGYWQSGDKSIYSFMAAPFVPSGVNVAVVGYDLCPEVRISRIVEEAHEAMTYLWRNAGSLGMDRERIAVMGHSAGGHLTQMMMATDWPAFGKDLPATLVAAGIPVSPVSYLEPVRLTEALNAKIRMDADEAVAQSPMTCHPPVTDAPQMVVVGGTETDEFHRQAGMYQAVYATPDRPIGLCVVPGVDHFDLLDAIADPNSAVFGKILGMLRG